MEVQNYEQLRNQTLLFFLERLLERERSEAGGGRRSLHDLSCQFGTKGFSKEMRQIAGGSKAGLKRFLSQYPSLFSVTDEYVSVATIPTSKYGGTGGTGPAGVSRDSSKSVGGGRDYGYEAMMYFKEKLRQYGDSIEVPIKSLLGHRSQAPPEVRHVSGQHVKEFTDFLLNYPDDLVVNEETESVHLKEFTGAITKMYSEDGTTKTTTPSLTSSSSTTSPSATRSAQDNSLLAERVKAQLSSGPAPLSELLSRLRQDYESLGRDFPYSTPENLRTFLKIYPGVFQIQGGLVSLATSSPLPPSLLRSPPTSPSKQLNASNSRISLKDRVSSVVQRAVAENNDVRLPRNGSSETFAPSATVAVSSSSGEQWFSPDRVRLVSQADACEAALRDVSARWKAVAVDIKGVNLGPEGRVSSVHISNAGYGAEEDSGGIQTYIFDFLQLPTAMIKDTLRPVLENDNILKVLHDCRNESATLWFQHGTTLNNVFDTQAAYAVVQHQENVSSVHKVKNVSLVSLCRHLELGGAAEELARHKTKRDQRFWLRRPIEQEALYLAALEVRVLANMLYPKLKGLLHVSSLPLFDTLCEEQLKLHIDPDMVKERKTQRKIELEVKDIKDKLEKAANGMNVVLSNREIRLLRFIDLTEDDIKKIKGSAKVAKKLERLTNPCPNGDDANPPSLESVSSESSSGEQRNNSNPDLAGLERIEKLEALIANMADTHSASACNSASTSTADVTAPSPAVSSEALPPRMPSSQQSLRSPIRSAVSAGNLVSSSSSPPSLSRPTSASLAPPPSSSSSSSSVSVSTQTLSTGDIVMTKVFAET